MDKPLSSYRVRPTSFLAFDLGSCTGWAKYLSELDRIESGYVYFRREKVDTAGGRYERWRDFLVDITSDVDCVYYEDVQFMQSGWYAANVYGGFLGVLLGHCSEMRIQVAGVPVGVIKKAVCGRGNAPKAIVKQAVNKRHHKAILNHNEADALALLMYVKMVRSQHVSD